MHVAGKGPLGYSLYVDRAIKATRLCEWQQSLRKNWHKPCFGTLELQDKDDYLHFTLAVYLGGLAPADGNRISLCPSHP